MNLISSQLKTLKPSSFVIARRSKKEVDEAEMLFAANYRRGNLPSLINPREFFTRFVKNSLQQSQSREIAARMQQWSAELAVATLLTEARNDEESEMGVKIQNRNIETDGNM